MELFAKSEQLIVVHSKLFPLDLSKTDFLLRGYIYLGSASINITANLIGERYEAIQDYTDAEAFKQKHKLLCDEYEIKGMK